MEENNDKQIKSYEAVESLTMNVSGDQLELKVDHSSKNVDLEGDMNVEQTYTGRNLTIEGVLDGQVHIPAGINVNIVYTGGVVKGELSNPGSIKATGNINLTITDDFRIEASAYAGKIHGVYANMKGKGATSESTKPPTGTVELKSVAGDVLFEYGGKKH